MIKVCMAAAAIAVGLAASDSAAQVAGPGRGATAPKRPVAAPKTTSARVTVKDQAGASLSGVHLRLSGAGTGEFTTGAAGTAIVPNLVDGQYRLRCERDGFITLERDFTLHGSTYSPIDIVLDPAPPPPAPPPPPPAPAPAAPAMLPGGPSITVSIPDFVDRNFIGREPFKESIIACKPLETVRLLQMREAVARHVHDRIDEVLYVVAGEGAVRIGDETVAVRAGALVVVPHGSEHGFERRGKNPLIVVSTLVGSACDASKTAP